MINRLKENYTQVDNIVLNNKDLSLKSKWLYAFLCSKPDNWQFSYAWLTHQLQEWEKALRSAIKELVDFNILLRIPKKDDKNNFSWWDWIINPTKEDLENHKDPTRKTPTKEVPKTASTQNGNLISNNNLSKTKISNNIKENNVFFENKKINDVFCLFIENRKQMGKSMTKIWIDRTIKKINKWLEKYSENDVIWFIDLSIENWWQGIFEKQSFQKNPPQKSAYEQENARKEFSF